MPIIVPRPVSEIFPDAPLKSPPEAAVWTNWFVKLVRQLRALVEITTLKSYHSSVAVALPQVATVNVTMAQEGLLALSLSSMQSQLVAGVTWTASVYLNGALQETIGPNVWQDNISLTWSTYVNPGTYTVAVVIDSSNNPNTNSRYMHMIVHRSYV